LFLYAESSAVIAWLLGESAGPRMGDLLAGADAIVASDLTLVECDRVLHRAAALGLLREAGAAILHGRLTAASSRWTVLRLTPGIVERARRPFPVEPIRSLDALHLAAALEARLATPDLALLSLDGRVRTVAQAMGMELAPVDL
jgi:predicted nucleic acid-binding protein